MQAATQANCTAQPQEAQSTEAEWHLHLLLMCGVVCTENNPALAPWGDALFYSAVGTLYRAAQLDAVATVAGALHQPSSKDGLSLGLGPWVLFIACEPFK
jgi:hypothetical protein